LLKDELVFAPITDPNTKRYEQAILSCYSIGIHIRREDFVRLNWIASPDYYKNMINKALAKAPVKDTRLFVFSDKVIRLNTATE
jgi:hypothetical protein